MPKQTYRNIPNVPPPHRNLSQAVVSRGTVYVSGNIGCNVAGNIVGGFDAQTRAALDNLKIVLESTGSGLDHILKVNVYLANLQRDFQEFNAIYAEYFSDVERLPARTCIGVATLPLGAFVEIECTAEVVNGPEDSLYS